MGRCFSGFNKFRYGENSGRNRHHHQAPHPNQAASQQALSVFGEDAGPVGFLQFPAGFTLLAPLLFSKLSIALGHTALQKLHCAVESGGIALGPGFVWLALLLPVLVDRELRIAKRTGFSPGIKGSTLRQAAVGLRRLRFLLNPTLQPLPYPHQALVGDVDHLFRREVLAGRWHQEGTARLAEKLDHLNHLRFRGLCKSAEVAQGGGPADAPAVGGLVGECLEQLFADALPQRWLHSRAGEFGVGLLGMGIEGTGHRADCFVVAQGQGVPASLLLPVRPGAVQGMLKNRKLVGVVAHVVHQPGHEHRLDLGSLHPDRVHDRVAALLRGEPGH